MNVFEVYKNFNVEELSYSTVRDFCDSTMYLSDLIYQNDMKDVARTWMAKAIVSTIPIGSRLMEIGAGEPRLANFLHNLGYVVTIVDPYDGSGRGPTDLNLFRRNYPEIEIINKYMGPNLPELENRKFDCIYSVSVLEHIDNSLLESLLETVNNHLVLKGRAIHTIDHIMMGHGEEWSKNHLNNILKFYNINSSIEKLMGIMNSDVETYFLSPTGHLNWKGDLAYEEFPFRRCVSINVCHVH